MSTTILTSRRQVDVRDDETGVIVAKAVRANDVTSWHIGALNSLGVFEVLVEILPNTSEVLGRKLVLAVLNELRKDENDEMR